MFEEIKKVIEEMAKKEIKKLDFEKIKKEVAESPEIKKLDKDIEYKKAIKNCFEGWFVRG